MNIDPLNIRKALGMLLAHGVISSISIQRKFRVSYHYSHEMLIGVAERLDHEKMDYEMADGRITLKWI